MLHELEHLLHPHYSVNTNICRCQPSQLFESVCNEQNRIDFGWNSIFAIYHHEKSLSSYKCDIVTSAFSVITDTPPRAESKLITCHVKSEIFRRILIWKSCLLQLYLILMIPKYIRRRLIAVINRTCDIDHHATRHKDFRCTPNHGRW